MNTLRLRLKKAAFSLAHPSLWTALANGVAPSLEHRGILRNLDCDLLLDVGANRGQFTLMARCCNPALPIRAYEPLPGEAAVFKKCVAGLRGIELHEVALGDEAGSSSIHVSNRADSSSLLPIGALQTQMYPGTQEVNTQRVEIVTLDSLEPHWREARRAMLKLDVQGYELNVLRGAPAALEHCSLVYAECSEVALYTGQALRADVEEFLRRHGFATRGRFNPSYAEGRLIQADYLFGRAGKA